MLARKIISPEFEVWNTHWGAPFGCKAAPLNSLKKLFKKDDEFDRRGMFGFQVNNDTRTFEYPWAYFNGNPKNGMNVLEIGGGMSGFQFAVAKSGANVTNVDPGMDDIGGRVSQDFFTRANSKFHTDVKLLEAKISDVDLEDGKFDLAYSISVIEHVPAEEIEYSMEKIGRLLKPGGKLIITVDLFLDLHPFSKKTQNRFGSNVSVKKLLDSSGLDLEFGEKNELYGFDEFNAGHAMELLPNLLIGTGYPVLVQCAILKRRE